MNVVSLLRQPGNAAPPAADRWRGIAAKMPVAFDPTVAT